MNHPVISAGGQLLLAFAFLVLVTLLLNAQWLSPLHQHYAAEHAVQQALQLDQRLTTATRELAATAARSNASVSSDEKTEGCFAIANNQLLWAHALTGSEAVVHAVGQLKTVPVYGGLLDTTAGVKLLGTAYNRGENAEVFCWRDLGALVKQQPHWNAFQLSDSATIPAIREVGHQMDERQLKVQQFNDHLLILFRDFDGRPIAVIRGAMPELLPSFEFERPLFALLLSTGLVLLGLLWGMQLRWFAPLQRLIDAARYGKSDELSLPPALRQIERILHERVEMLHKRERQIIDLSKQLDQLSTTDSLTGIANRGRFDQFLGREWLRAEFRRSTLIVLVIQPDRWDEIQRQLTSTQQDAVMKDIAATAEGAIHTATDLAARIEPDCFGVILPDTDEGNGLIVARKLCQAINSQLRNDHLPVTVSVVGYACEGSSRIAVETVATQLVAHAKCLSGPEQVAMLEQLKG